MRQGQAEAILVAYDIMDADDGQNVRPEHLEGRRKCLGRLLKAQAVRQGVQLSEAHRATATGAMHVNAAGRQL